MTDFAAEGLSSLARSIQIGREPASVMSVSLDPDVLQAGRLELLDPGQGVASGQENRRA